MKRFLLLSILLSFCLNIYPIYFKHIGMKEGLSQLSVMSVYQDELGRMWFATLEGISMFDGTHTTAFKSSASTGEDMNVVGNANYHLAGDNEGNIYCMSDNSLLRYNNKSQQFTRIKESDVYGLDSHDGTIWVGINDSIFTIDSNQQLQYKYDLGRPGFRIQKIVFDSSGKLWVGSREGLFVLNKDTSFDLVIPSQDIYNIFEDSRKTIWIGTRYNGMFKKEYGSDFEYFRHDPANPNSISSNQVRCFVEDNYGNIWIGTFTGLNKYNPASKQYTLYSKDVLPGSLTHSSVFSLYKDRQGSIWVGTYYGGVHYFNPEKDIFTLYSDNQFRDDCLSFPFVGHMVEDNDNNVWICTEGGGLNFFDRKTRKFTHYVSDGTKNSIPHDNLKSICYSPQRNELYIGTHTGGLSIFNITKKQFRNLYYENKHYKELAGDVVNQVQIYKDKFLVLLTQRGFFKIDLDTEEIYPLFNKDISYGATFTIDADGYIWISTTTIIQRINLENNSEDETYRYGEKGLGRFSVTKIFEDKKGRLFFGTGGSGLYLFDKKNKSFSKITIDNNPLLSSYCYDITQSLRGYLIISNDKGLMFIHPDLNDIKAVELGTALPLSGINTGCGMLVCKNGEIFIGGIDGAASFFEQELFSSTKDYQLYFSDLYINNELVHPQEKGSVLKEAFPYNQKIKLKHNQNNLIVTFTSNNYINTLTKTVYEYKLDGFDEKWITGNDQNISYTNLNPGNYTLTVREKISGTSTQPQIISMGISISPPFYATPLSYFIYCLLIISIIYGYYRFKRSRLLLETSLQLERKEKEKIEEINNAKLQFFSNISHEFRTPLTLIISQLELLLQSSSLAPNVYNKILKAYKNTYHMRNLISELLDFRKLEQGHVKLKVYEQDIIAFLKEIHLSFYEYAVSSSITYKFSAPEGELLCWFDPKQMQKVFYNLLTNAFKYSKANATIEVVVEENKDEIHIKIIDNGIGIDREHIDKIFDRFYQIDNKPANTMNFPSTGIGLSLTKSIVEMHHGNIQVESTLGYGSIFIVHLLKGNEHFGKEELTSPNPDYTSGQTNSALPDVLLIEQQEDPTGILPENDGVTYKALLVEDNEELLQTLKTLFSPMYQVSLARNGKEGLEMAKKERPDIIISDVMMPEMTGIEMCLKIKNDFDICHIPVVLLTALTSLEQNVEGLKRGADDYINKPFNAKVLLARCNNLVRNRIILQKKFSKEKEFDSQTLASNPIDQKFLDSINEIIEKNIDSETFDINSMAKEMALSRSSLYAKFKVLTGVTPNDYVLNCKLKRAAAMLIEHPELQIADISGRLGFGSPRYFTRCFKAQFDVSPVEYRKNGSPTI